MRNPFRVFTRRAAGGEEQRAITSVPWDQGGPLAPSKVTMERALRLGPVYAAGDRIAGSVSSLPLQAFRKAGDTRLKLSLPSLFLSPGVQGTDQAERGGLHDWLYRAVTSLAYRGNAIGLILHRDSSGTPTTIEWLHPDWVEVQDTNPSGPGSYINPIWYYRGKIIPRDQLVHIPWFVVPGKVLGLSPIGAYAAQVNTGLSAQDYSNDWFKAGGVPPGTFRNSQQKVDQQDAATIKARLMASIRTHEPIVYGNDWEYSPISIAPNEARFIETAKLTATQIAAIYGIPPEMIGGETGHSMTYANVEQNSINFVRFTLLPWLTRLESVFSALLPGRQYVKFNVDAFERPDSTTRFRNYEWARSIGLMSIDEIRALEDLPPLPNGQGQDYTPLSLMGVNTSTSLRDAPAQHDRPELVYDDERAGTGGSTLPIGPGHALWDYWTKGKGFAKWSGAVHKWTKLHRLLIEAGVPAHEADGLTTNILQATFPGYMNESHHKHRDAADPNEETG